MTGHAGHPAPDLLEVAQTWWDVERVPAVTWSPDARSFELVDPGEPTSRLHLATFRHPVEDPAKVAAILAEAIAACDFPPAGGGVPPARAARTLQAFGIAAELEA